MLGLDVRTEIAPLLVAVPSPLSTLCDPPLFTVLRPDSTLDHRETHLCRCPR